MRLWNKTGGAGKIRSQSVARRRPLPGKVLNEEELKEIQMYVYELMYTCS